MLIQEADWVALVTKSLVKFLIKVRGWKCSEYVNYFPKHIHLQEMHGV